MNPTISIIMPAYNASKYIHEAIDSILIQTFSDFELLICDDGSSDKTVAIINSYKDPRVILFQNQVNIGNLKTTNFLFSKCRGKLITIQDADDYSDPNRLELLLNAFKQDEELGMVGSNYQLVEENKIPLASGLLPKTNEAIKSKMHREVIPMLYASVMIKNEILKKAGDFRLFFNRKGYADLDWLARCSEHCKVQNINQILYFYRKHEQAFTFNLKKQNIILEHIHLLIVNAHLMRITNKNDYFEQNDIKKMKKVISQHYIKIAENNYWDSNFMGAIQNLIKAVKIDFKNKDNYKTFLYIIRNSIFTKFTS